MKPFLSVIIPTHNNSQALSLALVDIDKKLSEAEYSYEILVVNNGSEDKTSDVVVRFSRVIKNLKLINVSGWHGRGWAVREGMLKSAGNYRLFIDTSDISVIGRFEGILPLFKDGFQIIADSDIPTFGCFTEEAALKIFGIARISSQGFMKEVLILARLFGFKVKIMKNNNLIARFTENIRPTVLWNMVRIRYWLKRGVYAALEKPVL